MQQETLEEVAKRLFDQVKGGITSISAFKKGAKWQQEQDKKMHTEEEVELIEYIQWIIRKIDAGNTPEEIVRLLLFNRDKIEQFKKK
jgi:hypothetical protein